MDTKMKTRTDPLVLVADDGTGRVWIVDDGEGKSWYKPGADAGWLPVVNNGPAKLPGPQDVYEHFASHDPRWEPEVAAMLLTVRSLAKYL